MSKTKYSVYYIPSEDKIVLARIYLGVDFIWYKSDIGVCVEYVYLGEL